MRNTNFEAILGNIIAAALYSVLVYLGKRLLRSVKKKEGPPDKPGKKSVLRKQFFFFLGLLALSLAVFCSITAPSPWGWPGMLKVFSGLVAGLSFIITWGAFDAAFVFYPEDEVVEKPANKRGDHE